MSAWSAGHSADTVWPLSVVAIHAPLSEQTTPRGMMSVISAQSTARNIPADSQNSPAPTSAIGIDGASPAGYRLQARGRNVCVHLYRDRPDTQQVRDVLEPLVESIGGWLDATMGSAGLCFTIPVSAGFTQIEAVFQPVVGDQWYYSNVYDLTTDEPLNWWL